VTDNMVTFSNVRCLFVHIYQFCYAI